MVSYVQSQDALADLNDAAGTDQYLFATPFNGKILTDHCYVVWTEAVGAQTSTEGTLDLKVAGTTVGTLTSTSSAAIADSDVFVAADPADPWTSFSAGDAILVETGTQATGGTVTGEGVIHLAVQYDTGV